MARASADSTKAGAPSRRTSATRGRVNSRGEATRKRILLTAERLFAERGITAVPLLDIAVAAGQKNNVAVQYHFGDREGLVRSIIAFRGVVSNGSRVDMIAALLVGRVDPPQVSDIVRAYVLPLAGHLERDSHYLAFLSRFLIERGDYGSLDHAVPPGTVETLRRALERILPDIPKDTLDERWAIMTTCAVHTMARYQAAISSNTTSSRSPSELLEDLVRFLTAGIECPVGLPPDAEAAQ